MLIWITAGFEKHHIRGR